MRTPLLAAFLALAALAATNLAPHARPHAPAPPPPLVLAGGDVSVVGGRFVGADGSVR